MSYEAAKQAARLRALAEQVAEPAVAGRDGGKALKAKHRNDWRRITDVVCKFESVTEFQGITQNYDSKELAGEWKDQCRAIGIGYSTIPIVGWAFAIPGFWSIFFPLLIKLAIAWIESNRNQEQTGDR